MEGAASAEGVWSDTEPGVSGAPAEFGAIFKWAGAHLKNDLYII